MNVTLPVTLIFALLVMVSLMVLVFGYLMVLNQHIEMIYILRPYLYFLEDRGALTGEQLLTMEKRLEALGLEDIEIRLEGGGGFGDKLDFEVTGQGEVSRFTGFLKVEKTPVTYHYQREVVVRRIVN
jgi:hypothetical protein